MGTVQKYPAAEQDLIEIGVYIAQDSPANADRFIDAIEAECQKLADSPFALGRSCEGLQPELRRHNFKRYAIIYKPVPNGIELVGVFQGSRELEATFERLNERVMGTSSTAKD
ncbi:MAG TPA: type II toxin-antitoxin system RelE/ParE family toxin [Thermoanaerobaculia bacterium]|jgi:toxin ParE1/3/4|nr:type II toxin-antitoxin system RelE/ParE family toxin [Thermoanaerobaculia bacterium]